MSAEAVELAVGCVVSRSLVYIRQVVVEQLMRVPEAFKV